MPHYKEGYVNSPFEWHQSKEIIWHLVAQVWDLNVKSGKFGTKNEKKDKGLRLYASISLLTTII